MVSLNGPARYLNYQINMAAARNVLSYNSYLRLGKPYMDKSAVVLVSYSGGETPSVGKVLVSFDEVVKLVEFEVIETERDQNLLLEIDTCVTC